MQLYTLFSEKKVEIVIDFDPKSSTRVRERIPFKFCM